MNIHTRFVGAFDAIILSSIAIVTVALLLVLIDPSLDTFDRASKHGTVTIQQLAMDDAVTVHRM